MKDIKSIIRKEEGNLFWVIIYNPISCSFLLFCSFLTAFYLVMNIRESKELTQGIMP